MLQEAKDLLLSPEEIQIREIVEVMEAAQRDNLASLHVAQLVVEDCQLTCQRVRTQLDGLYAFLKGKDEQRISNEMPF